MQLSSGRDFLAQVPLRGDEVILDAGCGTGRVTRLLTDRVPRGRVLGVDASRSMLAQARERLGPEVELVLTDLLELELVEPVDLVFSTAAFHWIGDHERLFGAIHGWLRPGGRVAAQFGSRGNAQDVVEAAVSASRRDPFAAHLRGFERPWNFRSPEETASTLEGAGFEEVRCERAERWYEFDDPREFQRTVGLAVHLDRLPRELHEEFVDAVLAETPDPSRVHLIRNNVFARRPKDGDGGG
jgi:trans-aconitate 2-methyltransferase